MTQLETNIATIAALLEEHWADNWNFRAFLQQEVDPSDVDKKVHELNRTISAAIDCTSCGNCCRVKQPELEESDVQRLAHGMGVSSAQLKTGMFEEGGTYVFCDEPCPLLKENKCTVYAHRPDDCRDYPHLHKDDFMSRSIAAIENYSSCPIVFNVLGGLKKAYPYDRNKDYIGDTDPEEA